MTTGFPVEKPKDEDEKQPPPEDQAPEKKKKKKNKRKKNKAAAPDAPNLCTSPSPIKDSILEPTL